ncbi:hypothetical protein AB0L70_21030 [Kribbella sp. NPDC051952]|uniref:hypothetical protein n=1 Tax=Kribbella sp. NPDC051952 TaxID=3154851 RepID=UPI00342B75CA
MDWLLTLAVALAGVIVGAYLTARLQRAATYEQWRRDHLHDLYLELVPTLRRAQGALRAEFAIESNKVAADLTRLVWRAELICSDEVLAELKSVSERLTEAGVPWYVNGEEERAAVPRKNDPGSQSAIDRVVRELRTMIVRDLKRSEGRSIGRLIKRLQRPGQPGADRSKG